MAFFKKCIVRVLVISVCCLQENSARDEQDFSVIAKSKWFVDKTMFIRDFLREESGESEASVKVITAPAQFGKSTIVDMMKRFLQTQVYAMDGQVVNYKNNTNYNLFCQKPLEICKNNSKFVRKHFGQHPVIYVSFAPLKNVTDLKSFHRAMKEIMKNSYSKHKYFLNEDVIPPLYSLTKQAFRKIVQRNVAVEETKYFPRLAEILHDFFDEKVIILLDDYDALGFGESYHSTSEYAEIILSLNQLIEALFKSNNHLSHALITGERCVKYSGLLPSLKDFPEYRFVGGKNSSRYRGFIRTINVCGM